MSQSLNEILNTGKRLLGGVDFYQKKAPEYIYNNLRQDFGQRLYQKEAFGRFVYYWEDYPERPKEVPTQLLYHMATGSGKTLIMAGLMIYLYEQGYRNFLFFVNSTNIIDKTRDNFLSPTSPKYLFSESIQIGEKQIRIKEVDNFTAANQDDINIVFSTIQGLHSRLSLPSENSITFEDFKDEEIVLISDESHHINAETKKGNELNQTELFELTSWEQTVSKIFHSNPYNILLEFTATADLNHPEIKQKYQDKIIYDYPLKEFRVDGYSKEVKVLQADLNDFERALQAIILNQYRLKVFSKYGELIKPVILFKSRIIRESEDFQEEFTRRIKNLTESDLIGIKNNPRLDQVLQDCFKYFDNNGITIGNLITEIKEDFSDDKCLSVNSKSESEEKQIAVNTLEEPNNEYRAIFAVDKLNEGWDVLNLFDIVRLYNTRDARKGKPGKTTVSEAQLIGRGARYCPFQITPDQPMYQRKYDTRGNEEEHELKICEELYYHSAYNPRYIDELHTALEEIGIKAKEIQQKHLKLKSNFLESPFFKSGIIFLNEQKKYNREDVFGLPSSFIETTHKVPLATGYTKASVAFEKQNQSVIKKKYRDYLLHDFGETIIRKAINKLEFFQFSTLKKHLPNLESISEFISGDKYLGKVKIELEGIESDLDNLTPDLKLEASIRILIKLSTVLQSDKVEYKGTKEFKPYLLKDRIHNKTLNIAKDEGSDREIGIGQSETSNQNLQLDLSEIDWYVFNDNYGTSEEKYFVRYIYKVYEKLKNRYDQIYLVRNERHFKIYTFDDGRAIEPDFVLFLAQNEPKRTLHYQIFIEPKGDHLLKTDEWKENFLMSLKENHEIEQLWNGKEYIIWGMPFFNEGTTKATFEKAFNEVLTDS